MTDRPTLVHGDALAIGAVVYVDGWCRATLTSEINDGLPELADSLHRGPWADLQPGDTIRAHGAKTAFASFSLPFVPTSRPVKILIVSALGETLSTSGWIGDYNQIDVSFARRRIRVRAEYDGPRPDPNEYR